MRKNATALIIVLSLLFNGAMPQYVVFSTEYDTLLAIIHNQPLLQYYFSLSAVPITIVNTLLADENAFCTTPGNEHSEKHNSSRHADTSAEYSLMGIEKAVTSGRNQLSRISPPARSGDTVGKFCHSLICNNRYLSTDELVYSSTGVQVGSIFLLIILMLSIFLPRGAIGENGFMRTYRIFQNPIWTKSRLGFSFKGFVLCI